MAQTRDFSLTFCPSESSNLSRITQLEEWDCEKLWKEQKKRGKDTEEEKEKRNERANRLKEKRWKDLSITIIAVQLGYLKMM